MYFFSSPMLCFAEVSHTRALGEKIMNGSCKVLRRGGPCLGTPGSAREGQANCYCYSAVTPATEKLLTS